MFRAIKEFTQGYTLVSVGDIVETATTRMIELGLVEEIVEVQEKVEKPKKEKAPKTEVKETKEEVKEVKETEEVIAKKKQKSK